MHSPVGSLPVTLDDRALGLASLILDTPVRPQQILYALPGPARNPIHAMPYLVLQDDALDFAWLEQLEQVYQHAPALCAQLIKQQYRVIVPNDFLVLATHFTFPELSDDELPHLTKRWRNANSDGYRVQSTTDGYVLVPMRLARSTAEAWVRPIRREATP